MACVLVVDDDRLTRASLRDILEHAGHCVVEAGDGREALGVFAREEFSLMMVDIVMPEMDGLETIREVRRTCQSLPIVAMPVVTSKRELLYSDVAREFGADDILCKPFKKRDVLKVVDRILGPAGRA